MTMGTGRQSRTTQPKNTERGKRMRRAIVGLAVLGASLIVTGPASGYELTHHLATSSFDGTGTAAGAFGNTIADVAVDQQSGYVYVATRQAGLIVDKFDASGSPAPFSNPSLGGATSLNLGVGGAVGSFTRIAVDNSGTATQGRIYVSEDFSGNKLWAFNPDGSPVGGNFPIFGGPRNVGLDPTSGDLWMGFITKIVKFEADGLT